MNVAFRPPRALIERLGIAADGGSIEAPGGLLRECSEQLTELTATILRAVPSCGGDERFTRDRIKPSEIDGLREICGGCPVREACEAYADAAMPPVGFWAGNVYPRFTANRRTTGAESEGDE